MIKLHAKLGHKATQHTPTNNIIDAKNTHACLLGRQARTHAHVRTHNYTQHNLHTIDNIYTLYTHINTPNYKHPNKFLTKNYKICNYTHLTVPITHVNATIVKLVLTDKLNYKHLPLFSHGR